MNKWIVRIIRSESGETVKELSPMIQKEAAQCERGVNRNLNHEEYHTEMIQKKGSEKVA